MINAAGMWGREIAAMVGTRVPACAVEHQYFVTEKTDRIPAGLPTLRDPDGNFYVKPEPGALAVGGWETNTPPWGARRHRAAISAPSCCSRTSSASRRSPKPRRARIPVLNEVGIRQMINGPIPITADGEPIIGLSPELDNFYLCCGFTSGIAASGGAGWVMANWIVDGDPGMDLWPFDVRRFGTPHSVKAFMYERAVESYARYYHIAWPELRARRGSRRAAQPAARDAEGRGRRLRQQVRLGAAELVRAAGHRARSTRRRSSAAPAFDAIGAEHRAVRERVALIDMTLVLQVRGARPRRARAAAEARGQRPRPPGRHHRLHAALQRARRHRGRRHDHAARGRPLLLRHRQRARRARPLDASSATCRPTAASRSSSTRRRRSVLNLCGPRSRDVLAQLTDAPLDNASFPVHERAASSTSATRRCSRCASPTSASWATSCTCRSSTRSISTRRCGPPASRFGIANAGYRAVNSLRLEKHYLVWGSDITPDYNPYEAGLGFCVALGQGRVPRARRAGGVKASGSAAEAHVVHRAARDQSVRRRNRAGRRPRARAA